MDLYDSYQVRGTLVVVMLLLCGPFNCVLKTVPGRGHGLTVRNRLLWDLLFAAQDKLWQEMEGKEKKGKQAQQAAKKNKKVWRSTKGVVCGTVVVSIYASPQSRTAPFRLLCGEAAMASCRNNRQSCIIRILTIFEVCQCLEGVLPSPGKMRRFFAPDGRYEQNTLHTAR